MAFVYRKRDESSVAKRSEQQGGDFNTLFKEGFKTYKVKAGDNWIRILPPTWEDADHYGMDVFVHYGVGPNKDSVWCAKKMRGKKCPACDYANKLAQQGDDEEAKSASFKRRVAVWVIDRDAEKEGPQIYSMPWTLDRDIAKLSKDKRTGEIYYIDHPEDGYDVMWDKEGKDKQTKYTGVAIAREPSPVSKKWLNFVYENPLPDTIKKMTTEQIQEVLSGGIEDDEGPRSSSRRRPVREEEDDIPPPSSKRPSRASDIDDEEPQPRRRVAEEAEDAPPPRGSRRASVDEDEDPPPSYRRRAREPEPEEEERPARRRAREDVEEDEPRDRRTASTSSRPSLKRPAEEEEIDDTLAPRRRRAEPEEDDAPPPRRRASRAVADIEDDDIPFEEPRAAKKPVARDEVDEDDPRARLRRRLAERNK